MIKGCDVNKYGQAILSSEKLMDLVLQGRNIHHLNVTLDDDLALFQQHQADVLTHTVKFLDAVEPTDTVEEFHRKCADDWMMPSEYATIDMHAWLLERCTTDEQVQRVEMEYKMYCERGLLMLLRMFVYLVDYMRANRIVWGVGRGSAVASYILYVIGVHKVDSVKYDLPITDFLKEEHD